MNKQPIESARDADLRLSAVAMHRAAARARELARQTGTAIIISQKGDVRQIKRPDAAIGQPEQVQEPTAPYRDKP